MLYPRRDSDGNLISDDQMVGYQEHMTQKHRILVLSGMLPISSEGSDLLLALDTLSHDPIKIFISSPGGYLDTAFALIDTFRLIKSPIITIGRFSASAAALILAAGKERYVLPYARTMLHLPRASLAGDSHELGIQQKEIEKALAQITDLLISSGVKRSAKQIAKDIDREQWFDPKEAIEYGLADRVLDPVTWASWIK